MRPSRFNIRVYGLWISGGNLLINEEIIRGQKVIKFPGGGLELGEGIIDGLKREWQEELGIDIEILDHFYTTDFYQPSAYDDSQVISIYYLVSANLSHPINNTQKNEHTYWLPLSEVSEQTFTLPIDRVVGKLISNRLTL